MAIGMQTYDLCELIYFSKDSFLENIERILKGILLFFYTFCTRSQLQNICFMYSSHIAVLFFVLVV